MEVTSMRSQLRFHGFGAFDFYVICCYDFHRSRDTSSMKMRLASMEADFTSMDFTFMELHDPSSFLGFNGNFNGSDTTSRRYTQIAPVSYYPRESRVLIYFAGYQKAMHMFH